MAFGMAIAGAGGRFGRRCRRYAGGNARRAVALLALLLLLFAFSPQLPGGDTSPVAGQSGGGAVDWTEEYEFVVVSNSAPYYTYYRVQMDGSVPTTTLKAPWPAFTATALPVSSTVSSPVGIVDTATGAITLFRVNGNNVERLQQGGSWTTYAALGSHYTAYNNPSVAILNGALYILRTGPTTNGITAAVQAILEISGGNSAVSNIRGLSYIKSVAIAAGTPATGFFLTAIGGGKGYLLAITCDNRGSMVFDFPLTGTGQFDNTAPLALPVEANPDCPTLRQNTWTNMQFSNRNVTYVGNGKFVVGGNPKQIWDTATNQTHYFILQSGNTFPSPFGEELFSTTAPNVLQIDPQPNADRSDVTVTINWTRVPDATHYQIERNGVIFKTVAGNLQTDTYTVALPEGETYQQDYIRMRAVLDGGISGGGKTAGGTTYMLAPGERRFSPWTGRYEYSLLAEGFTVSDEVGDDLPPSVKPLPATSEVEQVIVDTLGLNRAQAGALTPLLCLVFAAIMPGIMVAAAPRSPMMLAAAAMLFSVVWIFAGWRWFGLPLPLLLLGPVVSLIAGFVLIKKRASV